MAEPLVVMHVAGLSAVDAAAVCADSGRHALLLSAGAGTFVTGSMIWRHIRVLN